MNECCLPHHCPSPPGDPQPTSPQRQSWGVLEQESLLLVEAKGKGRGPEVNPAALSPVQMPVLPLHRPSDCGKECWGGTVHQRQRHCCSAQGQLAGTGEPQLHRDPPMLLPTSPSTGCEQMPSAPWPPYPHLGTGVLRRLCPSEVFDQHGAQVLLEEGEKLKASGRKPCQPQGNATAPSGQQLRLGRDRSPREGEEG